MVGAILERLRRAVSQRLAGGLAAATARSDSRKRLSAGGVRRVLVICYGNIYRSPFVGEYLRQRVGASVAIRTAGFHPVTERPSPPGHVTMCRSFGVDLGTHRSSLVTPADIDWADAIVLMDRHNWLALKDLGVPRRKLVWLGSLAPGAVEIPDPYGLEEGVALEIVKRMSVCSLVLAKMLDSSVSRERLPR